MQEAKAPEQSTGSLKNYDIAVVGISLPRFFFGETMKEIIKFIAGFIAVVCAAVGIVAVALLASVWFWVVVIALTLITKL